MASRELPNLGLRGDWLLGEDGWKDENDINLVKLSVLVQARVSGVVADVPGSPAEGDIVLLDDDHPTHPNEIAVYDEGAWLYLEPFPGWVVWDEGEGARLEWNGVVWGPLVGTGIADAPEDGQEYVRKDGAWVVLTTETTFPPFSVGVGFEEALASSEVFARYTFGEAVTFADDFAGSVGEADTNPVATFTMDVQKNGASVGSVSISSGGAFTFTTTGTTVSFAIGDTLRVVGPATVGTAAGVSITFLGERD